MADEGVVKPDANVGAGSSSAPNSVDAGSPPGGEQLSPDTQNLNAIPYARFSEVIRERNEARARADAQEARLRELELSRATAPQPDVMDMQAKRLAEKLKLDASNAREIVEAAREVARAERGELESRLKAYEVNTWLGQMKAKFKDFDTIQPLMDKQFSALDPQERAYIASSPNRLEMFYNHVKSKIVEQKEKDAYEKGLEDAYKNKANKSSVSPAPGGVSQPQKGQLSLAAIRAMSSKEYMERQDEINDAIKKGVLK